MHYVIIGGGISGLVAAKNIRLHAANAKITLIEKSSQLGGLLSGIRYADDAMYFDQGTHISRETGNALVDAFIMNAVPDAMRITYAVGQGDDAGAVFHGALQTNSHFPTLSKHADLQAIATAIEAHVAAMHQPPQCSRIEAFTVASERYFGMDYTHSILAPILEHMYQCPKADLAWFAAVLPGLTRTITQTEEAWHITAQHAHYRAVLGFPDQRTLPDRYRSPMRSFYAKMDGSRAFIDGMARALLEDGITLLTNHSITHFSASESKLTCTTPEGTSITLHADHLINTSGIVGTAHLLGMNLADYQMQRPKPVRILNFLAKNKLTTNIAYFYGLDSATDFYRVTNYQAILDDTSDMRVTVEVIGERAETDAALASMIAQQLEAAGFMEAASARCLGVHLLLAGFPLPTTHNFAMLARLRDAIKEKNIQNLSICGIGSEPDNFFQNEIVLDTVDKIGRLFSRAEAA